MHYTSVAASGGSDWSWVPWLLTGVFGVATAILGVLGYRLNKASRSDTQGQQAHTRNMDWLDVARSELSAKIDAAKSATLLEISKVDLRLQKMDIDAEQSKAMSSEIRDAMATLTEAVGEIAARTPHMKTTQSRVEKLVETQEYHFSFLTEAINRIAHHLGGVDAIDLKDKERPVIVLDEPSSRTEV
jgi:hypothetical protein